MQSFSMGQLYKGAAIAEFPALLDSFIPLPQVITKVWWGAMKW